MSGNARRPLHALLLIDELDEWRGTETHLLRLVQKLDPARVRVTFATVGKHGLADEFRKAGAEVIPLDIWRVLHPRGVLGLHTLRKLIRKIGADLLVTYHTGADLLGPWAAKAARIPVLSSRRDDGFTKKPIHVRCQRVLNRHLTGMISVSRAVVEAVERTEGYPPGQNRVIWNGEDLEQFTPPIDTKKRDRTRYELGLGDREVAIMSVGGLVEVKDPVCQIRAMERLVETFPNARLFLVGDGPLKPALEARAHGSMQGRVQLLGRRRDVPRLLRAADIYTQTSHTEGFSNAILQAMATALPVVVTTVGGNVEFVHESTGILVPKGDDAMLAEALGRLVDDDRLRRKMGQAARTHAEAHGSLETMAENYMKAFEDAVAGRF